MKNSEIFQRQTLGLGGSIRNQKNVFDRNLYYNLKLRFDYYDRTHVARCKPLSIILGDYHKPITEYHYLINEDQVGLEHHSLPKFHRERSEAFMKLPLPEYCKVPPYDKYINSLYILSAFMMVIFAVTWSIIPLLVAIISIIIRLAYFTSARIDRMYKVEMVKIFGMNDERVERMRKEHYEKTGRQTFPHISCGELDEVFNTLNH